MKTKLSNRLGPIARPRVVDRIVSSSLHIEMDAPYS
jgi:hypothetical protein